MSEHPSRTDAIAKCAVILGVSHLNEDDDFFSLGGDSIHAAEVAHMLSQEYGRDVDMVAVMASSTFGDLLAGLEG